MKYPRTLFQPIFLGGACPLLPTENCRIDQLYAVYQSVLSNCILVSSGFGNHPHFCVWLCLSSPWPNSSSKSCSLSGAHTDVLPFHFEYSQHFLVCFTRVLWMRKVKIQWNGRFMIDLCWSFWVMSMPSNVSLDFIQDGLRKTWCITRSGKCRIFTEAF